MPSLGQSSFRELMDLDIALEHRINEGMRIIERGSEMVRYDTVWGIPGEAGKIVIDCSLILKHINLVVDLLSFMQRFCI